MKGVISESCGPGVLPFVGEIGGKKTRLIAQIDSIRNRLPIAQTFQVGFIQPEMVPDLMQHGFTYLVRQLFRRATHLLNIVLEQVNDGRQDHAVVHRTIGEAYSCVQPKQQFVVGEPKIPQLFLSRPVAKFDGDFVKEGGELRRQVGQGEFDETGEFGFAHAIGHELHCMQ